MLQLVNVYFPQAGLALVDDHDLADSAICFQKPIYRNADQRLPLLGLNGDAADEAVDELPRLGGELDFYSIGARERIRSTGQLAHESQENHLRVSIELDGSTVAQVQVDDVFIRHSHFEHLGLLAATKQENRIAGPDQLVGLGKLPQDDTIRWRDNAAVAQVELGYLYPLLAKGKPFFCGGQLVFGIVELYFYIFQLLQRSYAIGVKAGDIALIPFGQLQGKASIFQ